MVESKQSAETMMSDVHKKIKAAFGAFAIDNKVQVCEFGTIVYSLGCFPTQADIHELIAEVEEGHTGYIHLDKVLPVMTKVLLENRFPPFPEDVLLQAFEVLDKEKKGYLEPEELTKYMTQEGEPFNEEEMAEMMTAHVDREKNVVFYRDIISKLAIDPDS